MAVIKVRDPADPTGDTWISLPSSGPTGPTGPMGGAGEYLPVTGGTLSGSLTVQDDVTILGDGRGYWFHGGGAIWKHSNGRIVIRPPSGGGQPQIENPGGGSGRDIIDRVNGDARYVQLASAYLTLPTQANDYVCPTPPAGEVRLFCVTTTDNRRELRVMFDSGVSKALVSE